MRQEALADRSTLPAGQLSISVLGFLLLPSPTSCGVQGRERPKSSTFPRRRHRTGFHWPSRAAARRRRGEELLEVRNFGETTLREVKAKLATLPKARRKLITSHDAFGYFGAAYGMEFIAPEGVSTESEASAKDVANNIGNAGRTAHTQLTDMVEGFNRLNEFGKASEVHVETLKGRIETIVEFLGQRLDDLRERHRRIDTRLAPSFTENKAKNKGAQRASQKG